MRRWILLGCLIGSPCMLQAADSPPTVDEAAHDDKALCIQKKADACVDIQCTAGPASSDLNCPDKCQTEAKAQCDSSAQ